MSKSEQTITITGAVASPLRSAQKVLDIQRRLIDDPVQVDPSNEVFKRARMKPPCVIVLEDLDSMIDNKNRSFFLNELDGFHSNTGVVVLATTNHPEKLDSSILDRPSRFDRKYYFQLPAEAELL